MVLAEMINKRDKLTLPLKSHGYLLAIIEGYSNKVEAKHEARLEASRAGHTPVGGQAVRTEPVEVSKKPRSVMPAHVKAAIKGGNDDNK